MFGNDHQSIHRHINRRIYYSAECKYRHKNTDCFDTGWLLQEIVHKFVKTYENYVAIGQTEYLVTY